MIITENKSLNKTNTTWRLKLDENENIYGPSLNVLNTIRNTQLEDISSLSNNSNVSEKLTKFYNINGSNLILARDFKQVLKNVVTLFVESNKEILSFEKNNKDNELYLKSNGYTLNALNFENDLSNNKEKIISNISDNTDLVYFSTPDNVTGELLRASIISPILEKFPNTKFLIDCSYINFAQDVSFLDYIDLIKKYDNLILYKSFSYDYALLAFDIGILISDKKNIETLKHLEKNEINPLTAKCLNSAIYDEKHLLEIIENNIEVRKEFYEGLKNMGYNPYYSEGNYLLCDFGDYIDFIYNKLKNNGILTKRFDKIHPLKSCLRITIPKIGGVKFILETLKTKDVLIFDLDGVVFDVSQSYLETIKETYRYFSNQNIDTKDILKLKDQGGMNCDWDVVDKLLKDININVPYEEIIRVFQDIFYNPNNEEKINEYLINKERLLISKETIENISKYFDLVIFSGRLKDEVDYSLNKFDISKYFNYMITSDDLPKNMLKPHPRGVLEILKHCPHKDIKYLGDSVDDVISGNSANVETIGVIPPDADFNAKLNNFKHLGANYILDDIKLIESFLVDIKKD